MNGVTVDRQARFIIQLGKTVMDDDKIIAEEIEEALRDYGFKDAQVLGVVAMPAKKAEDPYTEVTDKAVKAIEAEELPRVDKGEVPDPFNH